MHSFCVCALFGIEKIEFLSRFSDFRVNNVIHDELCHSRFTKNE